MSSVVHVIIYLLLVFFVLAGVVASVYLLMMRFTRSRATGRFVVVIPPQSSQADAASLLCSARLRVGLMGDLVHSEVIALDAGMTEDARRDCEAMCRELDHTALVRPDELLERLEIETQEHTTEQKP